jgi:tetratricopeptide (TPR) repeat protein
MLTAFETEVDEAVRRGVEQRHRARAAIALEDGRTQDAIAAYKDWYDESSCATCGLFELGQAYEMAGEADSALAVYERAVSTHGAYRIYNEFPWLAFTYRQLGELYEGRGERDKAVDYYGRFVELWANADAELQPLVEDVRGRIAGLVGER